MVVVVVVVVGEPVGRIQIIYNAGERENRGRGEKEGADYVGETL